MLLNLISEQFIFPLATLRFSILPDKEFIFTSAKEFLKSIFLIRLNDKASGIDMSPNEVDAYSSPSYSSVCIKQFLPVLPFQISYNI